MAKILFSYSDRDSAHRKLEEVLLGGEHPKAECREDPNLPEPYQVWSGPQRGGPADAAGVAAETWQSDLDKLADLIAARLRNGG